MSFKMGPYEPFTAPKKIAAKLKSLDKVQMLRYLSKNGNCFHSCNDCPLFIIVSHNPDKVRCMVLNALNKKDNDQFLTSREAIDLCLKEEVEKLILE